MRTAFFTLVLFVFLAWTNPVLAATLYLDPLETEIYPGDSIGLAVRVDTDEGECINVIDAVIEFDAEIQVVDVSRGESIVPIWVEDPQIDTTNRQVTFAGGIPNGYCGRIAGDPRLTNVIAELIIQAPTLSVSIGEKDDLAEVKFNPATKVLLNDGFGTQAPLQTFGTKFLVFKKPRSESLNDWNEKIAGDQTPPQQFSITLANDKSIYNGRNFITFNTTDKQSGIDHYEVIEEPIDDFNLFGWGAVDAPWKITRSPYLLEDQTLNSTIRVKAIDKAGNEYIAVYVPEESQRGLTDRDVARTGMLIAGVILILVAIVSVIYFRFFNRKPKLEDDEAK
jgi:hypothetical protein